MARRRTPRLSRRRQKNRLNNLVAIRRAQWPALLLLLDTSLTQPTVILKRRAAGLKEGEFAAFVRKASRVAGLRGVAAVLVTSGREMRALNTRFRRKTYETDVLSFPSALADGFAGDIAISLDLAARNARRLVHSVADEVRILTLHGILHLAGYDHENDDGEMAATEVRLRRRLGLPQGLIERVSMNNGRSARTSTTKARSARARVRA